MPMTDISTEVSTWLVTVLPGRSYFCYNIYWLYQLPGDFQAN